MALKKIVLITTTQPAANPRLVKEADALVSAGHDVSVLFCYVTDWAQAEDKSILKYAKWDYKQIGGNNKNSFVYQLTRISFAFYKYINAKSGGNLFAEQAHARCYNILLKEAVKIKAQWYIGHNPGALAIAVNAATAVGARCGFDFEDYHRGEYTTTEHPALKRQIWLERKYVTLCDYISASSPLIAERIQSDFTQFQRPIICLLNTFPLAQQPTFRKVDSHQTKLKLLWFSQHVGMNRGLEVVIQCLRELNNPEIQLTLLGNCSPETKEHFSLLAGSATKQIRFAGVISPESLPEYAADFDIGLALEPAFSVNNNIALSNKIFTYLLAGNAIIFSETAMQKLFNDQYKTGNSFPIKDINALKNCLCYFLDNEQLSKQRHYNYILAQETFHWEREFQKLEEIIN